MTDATERRLTRLETNIEHLASSIEEYHNDLKEHMEKEDVWSRELLEKQCKSGGIVTGVAMAVSAIWAVGLAVFELVKR